MNSALHVYMQLNMLIFVFNWGRKWASLTEHDSVKRNSGLCQGTRETNPHELIFYIEAYFKKGWQHQV